MAEWPNTTHDWARSVDVDHLVWIRRNLATVAPGGVAHLILEVLGYAADEAESNASGRCTVTLHPDGSVCVADNGRGTDTRVDDQGRLVRKPIMATRDLRFFDNPAAPALPDGHPRRGMSVVAALSDWLEHTNRRHDGCWTQRYEHGLPVTGPVPIPADGTTGTVVHFRPNQDVRALPAAAVRSLTGWARSWPRLSVDVDDRRGG